MRHSSLPSFRNLTALLVLGIALVCAPPAAAEDAASAMQHHLDAARKARTDRDWTTAGEQFELALRQAELLEAGDARLVRALEEAARAFEYQKDGGKAIALQERAVELLRASPEQQGSMRLAEAIYRLGKVYRQFDDHESAEGAFRDALELREASGGHSVRVTMMRRDLSKTIHALRPDDAEAEELLQRDLEQGDTASRREHLGRYYAKTDQHDSSVDHFEQAIAIERELPLPSGRRLVNLLTSLATEFKQLGRYDEAEVAFQEAIELREDDMGARHPYLAFTLRKQAGLYIEMERWLDAETALLRARDLNAAAWGEKHHECSCTTGDMLAQVRAALGQGVGPARHEEPAETRAAETAEVAPLIQTAEAPAETAIDATHKLIQSHDENARRLRRAGNIEEAKDAARRALTLREETYGADSLEVASGLERLGRLWRDQKRSDEALALYERRLTILETALEANDPKVGATLRTLGQLERDLKRFADAEHYLLSDVNLRETIGQRIQAARTLETIGNLNLTRQMPERAEANFGRAVELWEDFAGDRAPEIVRNRARMAQAWLKLGRLDEAEVMLNELLEREQSKRYPDTSLTIQILQPLKSVLERTDRPDEAKAVDVRLQELRTLRKAALDGVRRAATPAAGGAKPAITTVGRKAE